MSEDPHALELVATALGDLVDDLAGRDLAKEFFILNSLPGAAEISKVSPLHQRCFLREEYVLTSNLPAAARGPLAAEWPYENRLICAPTNLPGSEVNVHLRDEEAAAYYEARAKKTKISRLRFRYSDLAAISSRGKARLRLAEVAVQAGIAAFDDELKRTGCGSAYAGAILVRAFGVGKHLGSAGVLLSERVVVRARAYLEPGFQPNDFLGPSLIRGIRLQDPKRTALPYLEYALRALEQAKSLVAPPADQQIGGWMSHVNAFGRAHGLAELSGDEDLIEMTARAHGEAWIRQGESFRGQSAHNVRFGYLEAWKLIRELKKSEDLKDRIKRELAGMAGSIEDDLQLVTIRQSLSPEQVASIDREIERIVDARAAWAIQAAIMLVTLAKHAKPAEGEDAEGLLLASLMETVSIVDGRPVKVTASPEEASAVASVLRIIPALCWPMILLPSIQKLTEAGQLNADSFLGPFLERQVPPADLPFLHSATRCLLSGDFIGGTLAWGLAIERVVRASALAGGKSTTSMGRSEDEGERELGFDEAVEVLAVAKAQQEDAPVKDLCLLLKSFFSAREAGGWVYRHRLAHGTISPAECNPASAYIAYLLCVATAITFIPLLPREPSAESTPS